MTKRTLNQHRSHIIVLIGWLLIVPLGVQFMGIFSVGFSGEHVITIIPVSIVNVTTMSARAITYDNTSHPVNNLPYNFTDTGGIIFQEFNWTFVDEPKYAYLSLSMVNRSNLFAENRVSSVTIEYNVTKGLLDYVILQNSNDWYKVTADIKDNTQGQVRMPLTFPDNEQLGLNGTISVAFYWHPLSIDNNTAVQVRISINTPNFFLHPQDYGTFTLVGYLLFYGFYGIYALRRYQSYRSQK